MLKNPFSSSSSDYTEQFQKDHEKLLAEFPITAKGISGSGANEPGEHYFKVMKHQIRDARTNESSGSCLVVSFSKDKTGIAGYWVPQGGEAIVPSVPDNKRRFVFTPDFSGCSLIAMQSATKPNELIVQHAEGGKHLGQVEGRWSEEARSPGLLRSVMTATDYGNNDRNGNLTTQGFAYYSSRGGEWARYMQSREASISLQKDGKKYVSVGSTKVQNSHCAQLPPPGNLESLVSLRNRAVSEEAKKQRLLPSVDATVSQRRGGSSLLVDVAPTHSNPFSSNSARAKVTEQGRVGRR